MAKEDSSDAKTTNVVPLKSAGTPAVTEKILNQKWGKDTMAANYAVVPSALLRGQARLGITATELAILIHLIDHWWKPDEMPWPSKKTLAERLRVGAKTIQRAMARLEEEGLIKRESRFHNTGGRASNRYDLAPLVDRLKPIAKDLVAASSEAKAIKKKAQRPGFKIRAPKKVVS